MDEDEYLTLTGRIKEIINKRGEKIPPVELDNVIERYPAVVEVVRFAVVDEIYRQDVGCAIKVREGEVVKVGELKRWIGARLAKYKVPRKVYLFI